MTRLILVRHGETEANVSQIWHGALDAPLTPQGEAQVAAVSARLAALHAETPIEHFYVSPLSRARITAQAIADAIGLEPEIEEGLQEMSIGDWEGRTFAHLRDVDRLWERWKADPSFAPPNGESPLLFTTRVPGTFQKLVEAHPGETILVVSHGGVISNLLAQWLGKGPHDWQRWDPANCSITILDQQGDGWQAYCLNDIDHLQDIGYLDPEWLYK
jgi:broad specificity phosphatase PhoE